MRCSVLAAYCLAALATCLLLSSCGGGGGAGSLPTAVSSEPEVSTEASPSLTVGAAPRAFSVFKTAKKYFQTPLTQGPRYVVTLQPTASDEDCDLQVFRPAASGRAPLGVSRRGHSGATVATADWVSFLSQDTGPHPIQVWAYSPTTPTDPNNFRLEVDEATQCALDYSGSSTVARNDSRWYWFEATSGSAYTVTLTPSSGNADLYVYGATSDKPRGSSTNATGADTVTFTARATGPHHVRVYGVNACSYSLSIATAGPDAGNLFFLHHSTGQGLIEGGMRATIAAYNSAHATHFQFWDHGYNGDGLHNAAGDYTGLSYDIPGDNTDPVGLHYLWTSGNADAVTCRNLILGHHEVIAFKSCFPASAIPDPATLQQYKTWYLQIRNFLDTRPDRLFVVMSTPPLHRLATNTTEANNARAFANWLKSPTYLSGHPNIVCFDLFDHLAKADDGSAAANRLQYAYEGSHSSNDSHPNATANGIVGPQFATFLCEQAAAYASR